MLLKKRKREWEGGEARRVVSSRKDGEGFVQDRAVQVTCKALASSKLPQIRAEEREAEEDLEGLGESRPPPHCAVGEAAAAFVLEVELRDKFNSLVLTAFPSCPTPRRRKTSTYFLRDNDSSFSRFFCRAMELEIPSWSLVSSSSFCLYSL